MEVLKQRLVQMGVASWRSSTRAAARAGPTTWWPWRHYGVVETMTDSAAMNPDSAWQLDLHLPFSVSRNSSKIKVPIPLLCSLLVLLFLHVVCWPTERL
jgi:hypothetical protein